MQNTEMATKTTKSAKNVNHNLRKSLDGATANLNTEGPDVSTWFPFN